MIAIKFEFLTSNPARPEAFGPGVCDVRSKAESSGQHTKFNLPTLILNLPTPPTLNTLLCDVF